MYNYITRFALERRADRRVSVRRMRVAGLTRFKERRREIAADNKFKSRNGNGTRELIQYAPRRILLWM